MKEEAKKEAAQAKKEKAKILRELRQELDSNRLNILVDALEEGEEVVIVNNHYVFINTSVVSHLNSAPFVPPVAASTTGYHQGLPLASRVQDPGASAIPTERHQGPSTEGTSAEPSLLREVDESDSIEAPLLDRPTRN